MHFIIVASVRLTVPGVREARIHPALDLFGFEPSWFAGPTLCHSDVVSQVLKMNIVATIGGPGR